MHFVSYREVEIVDQIIPVINQNERDFEDPSDVEDVAQEYAPLEIPKKKKRVQNPPKRKKRKLLKIPKINPHGFKRSPLRRHVRNLPNDPEFLFFFHSITDLKYGRKV